MSDNTSQNIVDLNDKIDALRTELFATRKELTETEARYYKLLEKFIAMVPEQTE
jgi:hypothetical protein